MKDKTFWDMVEKDKEIVRTWPEWKKKIIISAESAMSGYFIDQRLERLEK